jgi:methyl-accepting chemotaxis protein
MSSKLAKENGFEEAEEVAYRYSNEIKAEIEVSLDTARAMAQTFEGIKNSGTPDRKEADNILKNILEKDTRYTGVWTLWEPNAFDGKDSEFANSKGHDSTGRYLPYWNRGNGSIDVEAIVDYESGEFYNGPKETGKETILNPYKYPISGEEVIMSSIVVPVFNNDQFVGVAGIDIILDTFQDKIASIKPYETGYASLIANDGTYVADKNTKNIFKKEKDANVLNAIAKGTSYSKTYFSDYLDEETYTVYAPIYMGSTETPWSLAINVPMNKILEKSNAIKNYSIIIMFTAMLITLVAIYFISISIVNPIKKLTNVAEQIASDDLSSNIDILDNNDEIGDLSRAFHKMQYNLKDIVNIAEKVSIGDLSDKNLFSKKNKDGDLISAFIKMTDNFNNLTNEINDLTLQIEKEGDLSKRGNPNNFSGSWSELILGINQTLDAVIEPINEASEVLKEMSEGNLNVKVKGDYKGEHAIIKDNLNSTINNINNILIEVHNSANLVSDGSKQLSESSQVLSQGTTEQASTIQEITSSMIQLSDQTKENALNANNTRELSQTVKENAIKGKNQMEDMLQSMEEINNSSSNISKIIKVIDEIAFQTNILALNAAVEAARAGQHGKGFAVVSEEVRNLAVRSASAAKETTELIENSISKVETGTKIANETANALNDIVLGVSKAFDLTDKIAKASNEQAIAISQTNDAVSQVSQVLNINSEKAETSANATKKLSKQSIILKKSLSKFSLDYNSSINTLDENNPEIIQLVEKMLEDRKSRMSERNKTIDLEKYEHSEKELIGSNSEFDKY